LKAFENRVLRIFVPKREEVTGGGEVYIMRGFITSALHQILLG
jgi:hypothetical protein